LGAAIIAGAVYLLIPNGEYKPIQPDEQWTASEGFDTISDPANFTSGRPSLTETRETELGGAPTLEEQQAADESATLDEGSTNGETDPSSSDPSSESDSSTGSTTSETTPTPTPTPAATSL
jgi:hypothetical protein